MKIQEELLMLNFENHNSVTKLIDLDFDDDITGFSDAIYFIMMDELKKNEKFMKLLDIQPLSEKGVSGNIFKGDLDYASIFGFNLINAYVGKEGLEDSTTDISLNAHLENWKLKSIKALMFDLEGNEESSYEVYPEFKLPLTWQGRFKKYRDA